MRETGRRRSELAEMIVQREEEFIARWMERFQARLGPGVAPPTDVLDSVPRFLDDIVRQLTEPLDAREALQQASTSLEPNASSKHQRLELEAIPGLGFTGDSRLVRSVLSNLVGNAIKFSPEGSTIVLRARRTDGAIEIGVEDQCGGLAEETISKIFDPFVQVGSDRSGHGLGLTIARQAMEAHGGTIVVHNHPGQGCEMVATFPIRPLPEQARPSE